MKKLLFFIALAACLTSAVSCESEAKNPGDFSIACELDIASITSQVTGDQYSFSVARETDTTYLYYYTQKDTVYSGSSYTVTTDTVWFVGETEPATYRVYNPVEVDAVADTLTIKITSNANWEAPAPTMLSGSAWCRNYGSTTAGGGNGTLQVRFTANRTKTSRSAYQYIYTGDSTVLLLLPFTQLGTE